MEPMAEGRQDVANPEPPTTSIAASSESGLADLPEGSYLPGEVILKLSQPLEDSEGTQAVTRLLRSQAEGSDEANSFEAGTLGDALKKMKAWQMRRLFPDAGIYEERSRQEGLHLWYLISFDKSTKMGEVLSLLRKVEEVDCIEVSRPIRPLAVELDPSVAPFLQRPEETPPFDDPLLPKQWHYHNRGIMEKYQEGADINLYKAWQVTTGDPRVVVCVVDGGIDVTHPDLVDNLWVNEAELHGTPGVDDDGNGYVDDIHGYSFITRSGTIPIDGLGHGTHVAGTVAARSNNGIGVAGVAGGDGTPGTGVRLMSAAIFASNVVGSGDAAAAIKYGADNGALISQNSWGYDIAAGVTSLPKYIQEAIDYFIKYAGVDQYGIQKPDALMKGGVVIFAAGNEGKEYNVYPAAYEEVIAVGAYGPDLRKAYYSNYGTWVDIAAPGGNVRRFEEAGTVLSTVPPLMYDLTGYGYMQGTSMVCPHVSGIAALVLSKFGGPGYTADMLKRQLLASVYPINIDELNPLYAGKAGVGLIDAYAAVSDTYKYEPPKAPILAVESQDPDYTSLTLEWQVPAPVGGVVPQRYYLLWSDKEWTDQTPLSTMKEEAIGTAWINGMGRPAGASLSHKIEELQPNKTYSIAILSFNKWQDSSSIVVTKRATKVNQAPLITNRPTEAITLYDTEELKQVLLEIVDPEGHPWEYKLEQTLSGVSAKRLPQGVELQLRPILPPGEYSIQLTLQDHFGTTQSYSIPLLIIELRAPRLVKKFPSLLLGVENPATEIPLPEHFEQLKQLQNSYTAKSADGGIATAKVPPEGLLIVQGHRRGETTITVTASNGYRETKSDFKASVVQNVATPIYSIWPIPFGRSLNVWSNLEQKAFTIYLLSLKGELLLKEHITPDKLGQSRINTARIAPGSYRLEIKEGDKLLYHQNIFKK